MYNTYEKEDLNKEVLMGDVDFLNDASLFLAERGKYNLSEPKEIYDQFMEHFRRQNVNEYTATADLFHAQRTTDEGKMRMARLMDTYDNMDSDFGWKAAGDYAEGVLLAPSTYAGIFSFGAGKAAGIAAQQGIKLGIREILKRSANEALKKQGLKLTQKNVAKQFSKEVAKSGILKSPLKTIGQKAITYKDGFIHGGYKTAIGASVVDGTAAGYTVFQQERLRAEELGITDGMSLSNITLATALGGSVGGVAGSIFGSSKAVSANIAEQIRMTALTKSTAEIDRVHKKISVKTLTGKAGGVKDKKQTKKDALNVKNTIKMALKETVPEELEEGAKLKKQGYSGDVEFGQVGKPLSLDEKLHDNIASATAILLDKVPPIRKTEKVLNKKTGKIETKVVEERIASRLSRAFKSDNIDLGFVVKVLRDHNLTMDQLNSLMVTEYSQAGKLLGKLGHIAKAEKKALLKEITELDQKLISIGDIKTPSAALIEKYAPKDGILGGFDKIKNFWTKAINNYGISALDKATIGMMTIQTATTMRNTENGYMRNILYGIDHLGESAAYLTRGLFLKGASFGDKQIKQTAMHDIRKSWAAARTGAFSLLGKDLWFGMRSWETEALELLLRDRRFGKGDIGETVFKEMADVASYTKTDKGIVGIARKLNYLNTLSDNMFKRAVFSREIDKKLIEKGYKGGLKGFFEESYLTPNASKSKLGIFSHGIVDDKMLGEAAYAALNQTYQVGKYTAKEGIFNKGAAFFIDLIKATPFVGTAIAPFPRYLVAQLVFAYEHMPLIGTVNLGGILNKPGKEGVKSVLSVDPETFGKQVGGLAMLGTFYKIRSHFGDENTSPYEINNPWGEGTINLEAALGPFMAYAFTADILYRLTGPNRPRSETLNKLFPQIHDNDRVPRIDQVPIFRRDAIKALGGGQGRAGTGLYVVDGFYNAIFEGKSTLSVEEAAVKYLGNLFNRALVPVNMLKDIAGTVLDSSYRVVQDKTSVDFMEYFFKQAFRSIPDQYDPNEGDIPVYVPSRDHRYHNPLSNINPMLKMVTGLNQREERTILEKELNRLKFDYREIAPRKIKFDAPASNITKRDVGMLIQAQIGSYILSSDYQNLSSDFLKRERLKSWINDLRNIARGNVMIIKPSDTEKEKHIKYRNIFFNLIPQNKQKIIELAYEGISNGRSIHEEEVNGQKGHYRYALKLYMDIIRKDKWGKIKDEAFLKLPKGIRELVTYTHSSYK